MSFPQRKPKTFQSAKVVNHFKAIKEKSSELKWWKDILQINWSKKGKINKNNVKWFTIMYRPSTEDSFENLVVSIKGEMHIGNIMPKKLSQDELELIKVKNPNVKPRELKPSIQIQQWTKHPEINNRTLDVIKYPDDSYKSVYFQLVEYLDEIITIELKERIQRGRDFEKKSEKKPDTPEALEEVKKMIGHTKTGDTLISESDLKSICKTFKKSMKEDFKNELIEYPSDRIISLIQRTISSKSISHPGKDLPNPMTRITIPFDQNEKLISSLTIYDKKRAERIGEKLSFPVFKVNEEDITDSNVHNVFISRTIIDGIINLDSLCISNMGISVPVKATRALFVVQPEVYNPDPNDCHNEIFGDCDIDSIQYSETKHLIGNDEHDLIME